MRVVVVHGQAARLTVEHPLDLPDGSSVRDALTRLDNDDLLAQVAQGLVTVSVWGRKASPAQVLRADDRVELCRGLLVDPKLARRERFRRQGARAAGLFAKKRPGAKSGY